MASPDIPKSYKAVIYDKPGEISTKIVDLDTPTPGTYQQYVLGPADYVTPIPDELDSAAAAPM